MWDFRLGNEIRKRREEEDGKLMEKYVEMEAEYQAKKLPKLGRGNDGQRRQGARRKKQNGGRGRRRGSSGEGRSTHGGGREEERGKGKIEA